MPINISTFVHAILGSNESPSWFIIHIVLYAKITENQLHGCSGLPSDVSICLLVIIQGNDEIKIKATITVSLLTL